MEHGDRMMEALKEHFFSGLRQRGFQDSFTNFLRERSGRSTTSWFNSGRAAALSRVQGEWRIDNVSILF